MHHAHQPGALVQLADPIVNIQLAALCYSGMAKNTAGALGKQLPGDKIAVVLHQGEQYLVAFPQKGVPPAAGHQIDRLAGVAGINNLAGTGGTDETGNRLPSPLKGLGGPHTQLVGPPVHVGVVVAVVVAEGV